MRDRADNMSYGKLSEKYHIPRPSVQYIIQSFTKSKLKRGPKSKIDKLDQRLMKTELEISFKENKKCSASN